MSIRKASITLPICASVIVVYLLLFLCPFISYSKESDVLRYCVGPEKEFVGVHC